MEQEEKQKKQITTPSSSWSNLPQDILLEILQNLPYKTQIHFRSVCKNWRFQIKTPIKNKPQLQLPFALRFNLMIPSTVTLTDKTLLSERPKMSSCCLYDPAFNTKHTVHSPVLKSTRVHATKHGWILLSESNHSSSHTKFFFFSPFSCQTIQLPQNTYASEVPVSLRTLSRGEATFSAPPSDSDCVVCWVHPKWWEEATDNEIEFYVHVFTNRDRTWNRFSIKVADSGYAHKWYFVSRIIWLEGMFYFTYTNEGRINLVGFRLKMNNNGVECKLYPYPIVKNESSCLIECHDGQLWMGYRRDEEWKVCRFDFVEMRWFEVHSLGDRKVFLSVSSTSFSIPVKDEEEEDVDIPVEKDEDDEGEGLVMKKNLFDDCYGAFEDCGGIFEGSFLGAWIHPPQIGI